MSESIQTLEEFKQFLSRTFEKPDKTVAATAQPIASDDFEDDFEYNTQSVVDEKPVISDDFEDEFDYTSDFDVAPKPIAQVSDGMADAATVQVTSTDDAFVGISSVTSVIRPLTLREEIDRTIANFGFTAENCIAEFNRLYNTNFSTMEEVYSCVLYNNYFKHVEVTDVNTITAADLISCEKETVVEESSEEPVTEEPVVSKVEAELQLMDYQDFVKDAVHSGRITDELFEKYNDLYKALYIADYRAAFGTDVEIEENGDAIYSILVGRYMNGMSELDYKKIMYLAFRTDMAALILEYGYADSYADITGYKFAKIAGGNVTIDMDEFEKFYIFSSGKIHAYNVDLIWHNPEQIALAIDGYACDVVNDKLLFYDATYKGSVPPRVISCESSLTEFVMKPSSDGTFFYYNYNKFLDALNASGVDLSENVCTFLSDMSDLAIAEYDSVFCNLVKYNPELIWCVTSKHYNFMLRFMQILPGREPSAFTSYRLLEFVGRSFFPNTFQVLTNEMSTELGRESASINVIGIPGVSMIELSDFWVQFDQVLTYLIAANKITLSIFNAVIRLKIE